MKCSECGAEMKKIQDEQMGIYYQCSVCGHELEIHYKKGNDASHVNFYTRY